MHRYVSLDDAIRRLDAGESPLTQRLPHTYFDENNCRMLSVSEKAVTTVPPTILTADPGYYPLSAALREAVGLRSTAPVMAGQPELADADGIQAPDQFARHIVGGIVAFRFLRTAISFEVEGQNPELCSQRRDLVAPALPAFGDAMQENHRVAFAGLCPMPSDAVHGFGVVPDIMQRWILPERFN